MVPLADLAAVLRHPSHLDLLLDRYGDDVTIAALREEGLAPYVAWLRPDVPALADDRRRAALRTTLQQAEMRHACAALIAAGLQPVIFKGGAWAYTDYPEPWCRPCLDLDILVDPGERTRAFAALLTAGYTRAGRIPGELVNGQEVFERVGAGGTTFSVDLHWRVSNRVWLTQVLPTTDVCRRAVPFPQAGEGAWRAADDDGLLMACLHPLAHHAKDPSLKWSLDVALLAPRFTADAASAFCARVTCAGASALVADALTRARELMSGNAAGAPLLQPDLIMRLAADGAADPSRLWLDPQRDRLQDALDDLHALPTWRDRIRLVREHLLPPPAFVRARYGVRMNVLLPVVYGHRIVTGGARWIVRWWRDRRTRRVSRSAASRGGDRDGSAGPPPRAAGQ